MSGLSQCTLVLEFNYGKPGSSLGSVWLFKGDGTRDLALETPLTALPGWVRIAGPVDYELAGSIHSAIKVFLEESGVAVAVEAIAD